MPSPRPRMFRRHRVGALGSVLCEGSSALYRLCSFSSALLLPPSAFAEDRQVVYGRGKLFWRRLRCPQGCRPRAMQGRLHRRREVPGVHLQFKASWCFLKSARVSCARRRRDLRQDCHGAAAAAKKRPDVEAERIAELIPRPELHRRGAAAGRWRQGQRTSRNGRRAFAIEPPSSERLAGGARRLPRRARHRSRPLRPLERLHRRGDPRFERRLRSAGDAAAEPHRRRHQRLSARCHPRGARPFPASRSAGRSPTATTGSRR